MASITTEGLNPLNLEERSELTVSLPDELMIELVTAICFEFGYELQIENPSYNSLEEISEENSPLIDNPEGPGTFAMRMTLERFWQNVLRNHRTNQAMNTINQNINEDIQNELNSITIE